MSQRVYSVDLLVTGSYLYLLEQDTTIVTDGGVAIHRDTIIESGPVTGLAT